MISRSSFPFAVALAMLVVACGGTTPAGDAASYAARAAPVLGDEPRGRVDLVGRPVKGPATALVTVVSFSDFQCPFCSRVRPTLDTLAQRYGRRIRFSFVHAPLPFHPYARMAASAAIEAFRQRGSPGFFAMHDRLLADQAHLEEEDLVRHAVELGLDRSLFVAALRGDVHVRTIEDDLALGRRLGIDGTPSFLINGRLLVGAQPLATFTAMIDEELARADRMVEAGIPAVHVYGAIMGNARDDSLAPPAAELPAEPDPDAVFPVALAPDEPVRGPSDALVTIVEYADYECPFCARVEPTLRALVDEFAGDLRVVYRDYPLPFHQNARKAATLVHQARVLHGDEGFWAAHDRLYELGGRLGETQLFEAAASVGVPRALFERALSRDSHRVILEGHIASAARFGVQGTPSFFINGRFLSGARPIEEFRRYVDARRAEALRLVADGVPREDVYRRIVTGARDVQRP